jgi:hypothetical protein
MTAEDNFYFIWKVLDSFLPAFLRQCFSGVTYVNASSGIIWFAEALDYIINR